MEYVTDYDSAMGLAQGEWAQLLPESIDTRDQTQSIVDGAVDTMTTASANAKQQIIDRLSVTTQKYKVMASNLDGLNATGKSADAMRAACHDLTTSVEKLEVALNDSFADLDREITELGAEVSDVVRQFGTQFQTAGDLVEDGRTKWVNYVQTVADTHDTMISY